ncbi:MULTISPECIES: phage tail tape measure protein [unclassified Serratia (in: enterobacteria)]|uniref:phage tail tape measure protein n=1 Tax=unclassified Serratia (in: enterobacteria) TaxID=2647522 RepID=UPI0009E025D4|nr:MULTISPECIES: phage tail tape measure protein [unclassified Serratia (in: enterobacteria)]
MANSQIMVIPQNVIDRQLYNKDFTLVTRNLVTATTIINEAAKTFRLGPRTINENSGSRGLLLISQLGEVIKSANGERIKYENIRKSLRRLPEGELKKEQKKEPGLLSDYISDKQAEAARKSWQSYVETATDISAAVVQVAKASHEGLTEILTRLMTTGRFSFHTFSSSILQMSAGLFSKIISGFAVDKAVKWIDSTFFPAADPNKTATENAAKMPANGADAAALAEVGGGEVAGDATKEKLDEDKKTWEEYFASVTDGYKELNNIGQAFHKGFSDNLTELVTTGKANFKEFSTSMITMIVQVINQMLVAYAIQAAMGWIKGAFAPPASLVTGGTAGAASSGATGAMGMSTSWSSYLPGKSSGGYTGDGGKYDQAGVVHRGEFVMTKEATQRIGVGNLYAMMRGYADGGLVGNKAPMYGLAAEQGGGITVNSTVVMNNDGSSNAPNSSSAGGGIGKLVQGIVNQAITERLGKELKPGGLIWNASGAR